MADVTSERRAAESLLAFWAEVGVDCLYGDKPADRLSRTERPSLRKTDTVPTEPPSGEAPANTGLGRELARAAADLEALKLAIASFEGCPLRGMGARQAVCWRGSPEAPVMIIGEAPGADEDAQGAPFVGKAGRLLDRMLAAAGLEGRVFITNTVYWRPPGNRTPTPAEQLACAPFLERTIELVAPRYLLLVGAAAAKALLGRPEGILALRGRWCEWRSSNGEMTLPALPMLHPGFLLRQPRGKKLAWHDLQLLADRLDRAERPVGAPT